MNHKIMSFLLVLLLCYSGIRVSGFWVLGIWVGGSISVDIGCPNDVKGGEVIEIDITVRVLNNIKIQYFNIVIKQFLDTLYSKTLWQNQDLGKDFIYVDTLSIKTKETILSDDLELEINAKYSDEHWIYTSVPSLFISEIRPQTYIEFKQAYNNLQYNYSILQNDYNGLKWDYDNLYSTYYQLGENYRNLVNEYNSLYLNMSLLETTLNSTREELENTRYNLNIAYGQIVTWQIATVVTFVAGLITMYFISKRRVLRKNPI